MNMQQTVGTGIKVGELTVISNGSAQGHVAEVKDLVQGQNQIAHVELLAGTSDIVCLLSSLKKPLPDYEAKRSNKVYGIGETLVVTSEEDTFEKGSKVVVTRVEEERIRVKGLDGQLAKDGDNWHWLLKSSVDRLNKNISESHQYNLASPFDEKGWKQDDTFLVTCDCYLFPLGTLVKLLNDDNSSNPYFKSIGVLSESSEHLVGICSYINLDNLMKLDDNNSEEDAEFFNTPYFREGFKLGQELYYKGRSKLNIERGDKVVMVQDDRTDSPYFVKKNSAGELVGSKTDLNLESITTSRDAAMTPWQRTGLTGEMLLRHEEEPYTVYKLHRDDGTAIPYFKIVSEGLDEGKVVCRYARKMSEVEVFEDPCEGNVEVADELPVYNHQDTYVVNQDTVSFHKGTLVKITGDLTNASSVTAQCVTGTAKDGDDWNFIPLHCLSKYHADSAEPLKESLDKILGSSYIDTRKIAEALVAEGFIKG